MSEPVSLIDCPSETLQILAQENCSIRPVDALTIQCRNLDLQPVLLSVVEIVP